MESLQHSLYHSVLRVSALVLTCTLLFVSGALWPQSAAITLTAERYLANAVSATAGVAPTELNTITAALTEQQSELDKREASLRERELALGLSGVDERSSWLTTEISTWLNGALLLIVLVLLVINYTLDWRYRQHAASTQTQSAGAG